jgi:hypothetical protein
MELSRWLALAATIGCMAANTAVGDPANNLLTIQMKAYPQNAGKNAQVTLVPQKGQAELMFVVSGIPAGASSPEDLDVLIYPGSCSKRGDTPAYAVGNPYVRGDRAGIRQYYMTRIVPATVSDLTSADYAIVLRTGPQDGAVDIFCGDIKAAA